MKLKFCLLFILLISCPLCVYAKEYTDYDASIKYTIDNNWEEDALNEDRDFISKKWKNSCGLLMYGSTDFYSELSSSDRNGLSRTEFNDSMIDNTFASDYVSAYNSTYSINDWQIQNYNMRFVDMYGSATYYGTEVGFDMFTTLNNGYLVMFQYYGDSSDSCINSVETIIKSVDALYSSDYTNSVLDGTYNSNEKANNTKGIYNADNLLLSLIITIICYMIFPIIKLIINKGKYNLERAKKIALWNSIVVGGIFMILTIENGAQWQPFPAVLYYYINKFILSSKTDTVKKKNNNSKLEYTTCKCGCKVLKEFKNCPKCGIKIK